MSEQDTALKVVAEAAKNGIVRKGVNEATKAIERGQAKLVAFAEDVSPKEITMHLPGLCEEKGVPCVAVPSKAELGKSAGLGVGTTAVAVTKCGAEAEAMLKQLAKTKKAE